jgi:hypothetical protein
MTEQMHKRQTPIYVLLDGGEVTFTSGDRGEVLREAHCAVDQHITDHLRHDLPIKLDDEEIRWIDVEVHELSGDKSQIALPYQQWADDYWVEVQEAERDEDEREYKRFLELRDEYEERFQLERARERARKR